MRTLVWFRGKDLRVHDHAPLHDAAAAGEVVPLFVLDPYFFAPERARELPHRMQFLQESLAELGEALAALGAPLQLVEGRSVDVVPRLADEWRCDRVVAHRWSEPFARERDRRVAAKLGARFELYEGETLLPPGTLRTRAGTPFAVFSQFARAFRDTAAIGRPLPAPRRLQSAEGRSPRTRYGRASSTQPRLQPGGETAARERLKRVRRLLPGYARARDQLAENGTTRLSADLHFGTLSVREAWNAGDDPAFRNELLWREFAHHTLYDRPDLLEHPFRREFEGFPWRDDDALFEAWAEGRTGFPVVDAAARQLKAEGYVHNRARMIAASFLAKDLLIDFRRGEAHYMKWLTDGDWANNDMGWQWSAGCGCDAQPYFRIFNPDTQAERFDPDGAYVRKWAPDSHALPKIVDHKAARERFLSVARAHLRAARPPSETSRSPRAGSSRRA